jgi:hypothetical protein
MPDSLQDNFGFALFLAQLGEKHDHAISMIYCPTLFIRSFRGRTIWVQMVNAWTF